MLPLNLSKVIGVRPGEKIMIFLMEDWMNKSYWDYSLWVIDAAFTFLGMQAKLTSRDHYRNFDQVIKSVPILNRGITSWLNCLTKYKK